MNFLRHSRWTWLLPLSAVLILSLACGSLGGGGEVDLEGTQSALEATEAALSRSATEQASSETERGQSQDDSSVASSGLAELVIYNDSATAVCYLYVSPTTSDEWGSDQLGPEEMIDPHTSYFVSDIPPGTYDIMAEFCDGEQVVEEGIQLEDEYTWTLYDMGLDEDFMVITDDYNSIEMEVPLDWYEYNGEPWYDSGDVVGAQLIVSPDLEGFLNTWNVPGVRFSVSDDLATLAGYLQLLNLVREDFMSECELDDRYDYEDNLYRGKYDIFTKCGGPGGPSYMILSAVSKDDQFSYLILVEVQMLSDEDWDYAQHILDTFQVVGDLP